MKKAILTYILGGYDALRDPAVVTPGWDYVCVSDQGLKSEIWRPSPLNGRASDVPEDKRKAGLVKIGHYDFVGDDCDLCVTLDGSMRINCDLNSLLGEVWSEDADLAIARHPWRDCLYDEAREVKALGFDDPAVIARQIRRYRRQGFPRRFGLYATGMMIKNNRSPRLRRVCERWAAEYRAGSRRDQLSLTYAIWKEAQAGGEALRVKTFDFMDVFRQRKLVEIADHRGSRLWPGAGPA